MTEALYRANPYTTRDFEEHEKPEAIEHGWMTVDDFIAAHGADKLQIAAEHANEFPPPPITAKAPPKPGAPLGVPAGYPTDLLERIIKAEARIESLETDRDLQEQTINSLTEQLEQAQKTAEGHEKRLDALGQSTGGN